MPEILVKNLWTLVTIVLPGLFTYGLWRLLLLLNPSIYLTLEEFSNLDQSSVITWSLIISIALLQQSLAIVLEFVLYKLSQKKVNSSKYLLFVKRFELSNKEKLKGYNSSVVGNFFLSLNILVGLSFLLVYFVLFEKVSITHWVPILIIIFMISTLINSIYRYQISIKILKILND